MHRHRRHRDPAPPPRLQLSHPFARLVLGGTVAVAVLGAGAFVFGPFSDLSALQLAAGPNAQGASGAPAATVLARTGRSWGAIAQQRQAAAASAPIARIARRDTHGP
ncbi:MAG: hypothetical protein ABI887_10950 [Burkholderiales bacterium]